MKYVVWHPTENNWKYRSTDCLKAFTKRTIWSIMKPECFPFRLRWCCCWFFHSFIGKITCEIDYFYIIDNHVFFLLHISATLWCFAAFALRRNQLVDWTCPERDWNWLKTNRKRTHTKLMVRGMSSKSIWLVNVCLQLSSISRALLEREKT